MQAQQVALLAMPTKSIHAWIVPNIGAIAAMSPEFDIVARRANATLIDEDQFVSAPVEGAQAGLVLHPNADVLQLSVDLLSRLEQRREMTPIDAHIVHRPLGTVTAQVLQHQNQKVRELILGHLPGAHGKFAVADSTPASGVAVDAHIVRRVSKDHARQGSLGKGVIRSLVA